MERLTTDAPNTNLESALNLFYAKDGEARLRYALVDGKYTDISLFQFVRLIKGYHDLDIDCSTDDAICESMDDWLSDGLELHETVAAIAYTAIWVAAELRAKLKEYEDKDEQHRKHISYTERCQVYSNALAKWGDRAQMIVAIEELSECQKEICKILRDGENFPHLAEEIADATIMLEQLRLIFNINDQVLDCMDAKVRRLGERLGGNENG